MLKLPSWELAKLTRDELQETIKKIEQEILELKQAKERALTERSKRDFEAQRNSF